jgi:chromosomal replication initiation ATPase DnaA
MSAETDFEKLLLLIPHRYHCEALNLLNQYLSPEMKWEANDYLKFYKKEPEAPAEIIKVIFQIVGEVTGVENVRDTKRRIYNEVMARQLAMYAIYYELTNFGLSMVGQAFTHKFDHATVINAKKSIESHYATDGEFRRMFNQVAALMEKQGLTNLKARISILKTL